jgi:hypothetical protein
VRSGWRGRNDYIPSYSTAGLAFRKAARLADTNDTETSAAWPRLRDLFLLNLFQCWRNRDAEELPIFSLFRSTFYAGPFFLANPSVRTCPKASPVSVAHSPSHFALSLTNIKSGFKRSHPRHHPCIPLPHQQKGITIERIAIVRHFPREQNPRFLTPCAGLAHRSRGPHPAPTSRDSPFISLHKRYDGNPKTTTHSCRYAASIARLAPHSNA